MGRVKNVFYSSAHSASQFCYNWKRNEFTSSVPGFQKPTRLLAALPVLCAAQCILLLRYESGVSVCHLPLHMCIHVMNKYMTYNSKVNESKLCNAKTRSGGVWVDHNVSYSARLFAHKDSLCSLLLLRHHWAIFNRLYTLHLNRLLILPKNF